MLIINLVSDLSDVVHLSVVFTPSAAYTLEYVSNGALGGPTLLGY